LTMEQARISSPQGTQAPQTARTRQGNDGAGATASPSGFLALLSALDQVDVHGTGSSDLAGETIVSGDDILGEGAGAASGVADASFVAAWQGLLTPDAVSVSQAQVQGGAPLGADGAAKGWSGTLLGSDGLRQGLVAETALLDSAADVNEAGLQGPVAGYGRILSRMQSALVQRAGNTASAALQDTTVGRAVLGNPSHPPAMTPQAVVNAFQSIGENAAAVTGQPSSAQLERTGGVNPATFASESLPSSALGVMGVSGLARGNESPGGRSGDGQPYGGAWSDGAGAAGAMEAGGVGESSVFADPSLASAEELVTDQIAYWVNQKTQTAELTLDRAGQPVEVSVSLSGNEAHVTFRSDQSETRELLDSSMAQLSDLLRSEGLVLSGMSVGTSARDGAGAGESGQQRNREGARQEQVVTSAPTGATVVQRTGGVTERTVDVFV
jgi:flagellar hook-length control protein FliK